MLCSIKTKLQRSSCIDKMQKRWRSISHIVLDLILLPIIYFTTENPYLMSPIKLGFYCDDPKLSFEIREPIVSGFLVFLVSLFIPLFIFVIVEFVCHRKENIKEANSIKKAFKLYKSYWIFFFIQLSAGSVIKLLAGEPRPNFFNMCQPNVGKNCTGYIYDYECTNPVAFYKDNANKSFPSGHALMSTSAALILIFYLHKRLGHLKPRLPLILIQMTLYSMAVISSVSRISDHYHHWWDVLAGVVMGIIFSYFAIVRLFNNFETKTHRESIPTSEA